MVFTECADHSQCFRIEYGDTIVPNVSNEKIAAIGRQFEVMWIRQYRLAGLFERCRHLGLQRPNRKKQQQYDGESSGHGGGLFVFQSKRGAYPDFGFQGYWQNCCQPSVGTRLRRKVGMKNTPGKPGRRMPRQQDSALRLPRQSTLGTGMPELTESIISGRKIGNNDACASYARWL
jgi:hypothetical protein